MPDRTPSGSAPPRGAGRTIKTILKLYFIKNKLKEFIIILTLFILIIKLLRGSVPTGSLTPYGVPASRELLINKNY